jgi:hypothetical protein
MTASEDHVINMHYKLPSIFYENRIGKTWWESVTLTERKEIINEYIKSRPDKEHLRYNMKENELYYIYLFYTHSYSKLKKI